MLETFHFLRPEWLTAIPFVALLLFFVLKRSSKNSGWEKICDPALLQYQLAQQDKQSGASVYIYNWLLPFIFIIGLFALAGPTWEKKEQPVFQQGNALVIILDLSLSMNAKDLKPSRLERAKLKLIDILKQKKEGQTALIAFAGDAHTVSPLTIDNKTIMSLLPSLDSSIMPLTGSHLVDALTTAKQLFKNAGFTQGDVLLLSDGIDSTQQSNLKNSIKKLRQQGYRFSVIGVGSQAGSPIPIPRQGGFIKDASGQVVLTKLEAGPLINLASIGGGTYHKLSLDDSDFQALLDSPVDKNNTMDEDKQLEQWVDAGAYFTLLLIPLALFSFRKGLLNVTLCLLLASSFVTEPSYANEEQQSQNNQDVNNTTQTNTGKPWSERLWSKNMWTTADQKGQKAFNAQDYQTAAKNFSDNNWKASANYRAGNYEKALEQYAQSNDAKSLYNKGNTLANMNKFQEAIDSYEQAIKYASESRQTTNPTQNSNIKENAQKNLDYLKELLAQQQQQSSDKNSDQKNDDSKEKSENQKQEQENSSDDASKGNESSSDESEQKDSEESESEGAESGEKQEESSDSENQSESQEQDSPNEDNEPQPEEAQATEDQNEETPKDEPKQSAQSEPMEEDKSEQDNAESTQNDVLSQLTQEEQQSLKQWLQRIPDNPGELLRIKFRNNTLLKQRKSGTSDTQYEGNPW
ncbi:MAG: VWA domain-containing protein [Gammaproteobacteria bacterium]|nr:VWA domain-containing protein [Gammaproteobacteria bacterium]